MTLAEALAERAALQAQIEDIKGRLVRSSRVQEGEAPPEDPAALFALLDAACDALEGLLVRINRTNLAAEVSPGVSVTAALARRDVLRMRLSAYRGLLAAVAPGIDRYSRSEIRIVRTVDVREVQATADRLSKAARELDTRIQAVNWTTDLMA